MNPSAPSQTPMTILRICVWLVPGFVLIFGFILAARMEVPLRILLPLTFCVFIALGYFDMRLKLQIEKADPKPLQIRVLCWAMAFASVQIIIAPAVALVAMNIYFIVTDTSPYFP